MDHTLSNEDRIRLLELCSEHLGGAWKDVSSAEVEICQLT